MILASFVILGLAASPILGGPVQKQDIELPACAIANKAAAVAMFQDGYSIYKQFAFGHDELAPVARSFSDGRNGWGATIVDAMSTMNIMGLDDLFQEAVDFSSNIDFSRSKTPDAVSVFETTIRYLGGLLSAYELSNQEFPALLQKAIQLGDKLAFAFSRSQHNVVPFRSLNFSTNKPSSDTSNIAEAGSLSLEWETLSKYSGNSTYGELATGAVAHIAQLSAPLPGLPAQVIDPSTGVSLGGYVTWGGGSDSYFEYLIKHARLSNTDNNLFADTWFTAVDSSIKTLLRTSTVGNHVYLADFDDDRKIRHIGSHLGCFVGGNWLFGGRLLDNDTIVEIGLQLVDACWNTYTSTVSGIGPEAFAFISKDGNFTDASSPTQAQLDFYNTHGFYVTDPAYFLRPEVLESNFYAYRVTGDSKYLDRAAAAMNDLRQSLSRPGGFELFGLVDVNDPSGVVFDNTPSYWFAEVLKYLYLTFDDPNHISLDEYVFSTEAHLFKAPPLKSTYGSGRILPLKPGFVAHTGAPTPAISLNPQATSTVGSSRKQ